jgi:hypothetical protein
MPAPKRTASSTPRSSSAKPAAKRASASARKTAGTAASGAKATATSTRKAAGRASTQAKSGATKTANTARSGAATTRRSANAGGARTGAKPAGAAAAGTARSARSGAKGTTTAARAGAKQAGITAKGAATSTRKAGAATADGIGSLAEQLASRAIKPRDLVMLTRDRIQETLDEAASRGRVTRKDANDLLGDLESLFGRGRDQLESATKRARKAEPVDRIVRSADRVRRTAGVGPSFPILGYDELNVGQVQSRIKELRKPDLRKVLTYERKHANRKSVVGALEKAIG